MNNEYLPFRSEILEVIKHADVEYTFRMAYDRGKEHPVKPGQFFEISIPKYGEAPISVSGITDHSLDFTIRKVGSLTDDNAALTAAYSADPNSYDKVAYESVTILGSAAGTTDADGNTVDPTDEEKDAAKQALPAKGA